MAVITADESGNVLGDDGRNVLQGDEEDNYLDGYGGRDWVFGKGGNDILIFDNADQMLHGGEGFDTLRFSAGNQTATLSGKPVINSIEAIDFASTGNTLTLTAADIELVSDNDALVITGISGNLVNAGTGWDYTGLSTDGKFYEFTQGGVSLNVQTTVQIEGFIPPSPKTKYFGGDDSDRMTTYESNVQLYGKGGFDSLISFGSNNDLFGGDGNDSIASFGQNDILYGEDGNDQLGGPGTSVSFYGGAGDDLITFSSQVNQVATGDSGADRFVVYCNGTSGTATITDFQSDQNDNLTLRLDVGVSFTVNQLSLTPTGSNADGTKNYVLSYTNQNPDGTSTDIVIVKLIGSSGWTLDNLTPAISLS